MQPRSQLETAFSHLQMPYKTWTEFEKDFPSIIKAYMDNPQDPLMIAVDYFLENETLFDAHLKKELDKKSEEIKNANTIQLEIKEEELKQLQLKIQDLENIKKQIDTLKSNPTEKKSDLLDKQKNLKEYLIRNFLLKNLNENNIVEIKNRYINTMSDKKKKEILKQHLNNQYRQKLKSIHPDKKSTDDAQRANEEFKNSQKYAEKSNEILTDILKNPNQANYYENSFENIFGLHPESEDEYDTKTSPSKRYYAHSAPDYSDTYSSSSYSSSTPFRSPKSDTYINMDSESHINLNFLAGLLNTFEPGEMTQLLNQFKQYLEKEESGYLKFSKATHNLNVYHIMFEYLSKYFLKNSYGYDKSNKALAFIKLIDRIPIVTEFFKSEMDSIKKAYLGPEPTPQEISNLSYKPSQYAAAASQTALRYTESNGKIKGEVFFKLDLNQNFDFNKELFLLEKRIDKLKENYKKLGVYLEKEVSGFYGNFATFYTNNPYVFYSLQNPYLTGEHNHKDLLTLISALSNTLLGFPGSDLNGASTAKTTTNMKSNQLTISMTNMHYAQQTSALLMRACPSLQFKNEITHGSYTFQNPFEAMYYLENICHIPKKQVLVFMKEHLKPTQDLSNQFKEYAENQFQLLIDKLKNKISHMKVDDRVIQHGLFKNKYTIKTKKIEALSNIIVHLMDQNKTDSLSDRLHSKTIQDLLKKSPHEAKTVLESLQQELRLFSDWMAPEKTNQTGFNPSSKSS